MYVYICVHTHTHMYVYMCMYICIYIYTYMCMYMYVCMCVCMDVSVRLHAMRSLQMWKKRPRNRFPDQIRRQKSHHFALWWMKFNQHSPYSRPITARTIQKARENKHKTLPAPLPVHREGVGTLEIFRRTTGRVKRLPFNPWLLKAFLEFLS